MATVNGVDGAAHDPGRATLDKLLKDDKFGLEDVQVEDTKNHEERSYQACLGAFIRGEAKECLEKMYELDLLKLETLNRNEQVYALFQGACDAIKNFDTLGTTLHGVTREVFTGTTTQLRNHLLGKTRPFEIAILNRYYRCCAKVLQLDSPVSQVKIDFLEAKMRDEIDRHSCEPWVEDTDSAVELQQLVETYIFHVQIALLHRPASAALYQELSEAAPGLSKSLSLISTNGKTVEQHVLDRLETKQRKSKKPNRRVISAPTHSTTTPENALLSPESGDNATTTSNNPIVNPTARQHQNRQLQSTPVWMRICQRFINKFKSSRQTMLIALVLLLLSARKIKGLSRLPEYVRMATRNALPYIQNVLKLLSSI